VGEATQVRFEPILLAITRSPAYPEGPVFRNWIGRLRAEIAFELKGDGGQPVFLDLAGSIIREIERGRLKPGDALPGTRSLARSLKLNRNTVDAAYHELTMQGWLTAEPSRGTFVARDLPDLGGIGKHRPRPARQDESLPPSMLHLSDGAPDPRLAPRAELARAFRWALEGPSFLTTAQDDPRGSPVLRRALSAYLVAERGLAASAEDVLVTRGSQMALFLAVNALLDKGEAVAVETPGYPLAWSAFRAAGVEIVGVPVDGGGLDVEQLAGLAARKPSLRAIYLTPHHQYPTTVTLGAARRLKLLEIARRHGLIIIEDDYDHEYRFDGRPILPIAARATPDDAIVYVGSLSKLLAPGVRVGYAVAAPALLGRMAERREAIDRQGDLPLEQALAGLIEDGTLRRHARKARRIYQTRRNLFGALLTRTFGDAVSFTVPAGGLAVWLRLSGGVSAREWTGNAAALGLCVMPGARFSLGPARAPEAFRLGFATLDEAELARAMRLLAEAKPPAKRHGGIGRRVRTVAGSGE
jgi:GntR family transcriptional regulator/MocR family aminotransferase